MDQKEEEHERAREECESSFSEDGAICAMYLE